MKLFAIVHFIKDNTVEIVPKLWIKDGQCKFPNKLSKAVKKQLKKSESFPNSTWPEWKIEVIKECSKYPNL